MNIQTDIPKGYMKNARGELIPEGNVKPEDKLEDELVRKLIMDATQISNVLAGFKHQAMSETVALKETVAAEYGAMRGGKKGNMTLRAFDGSAEVQVQVSEHLSFGTQLMAAKELIDDCIVRWSEGASDNIRALIDQAFQVNKEGRIDTHRVLALRKLDMGGDKDWARAMDAISDAIRVTGSKTYIRFYSVDPSNGKRTAIPLDLAAL